jgi:hypothetical protein
VGHTFLLDAGRWVLKGNWLERDQPPIPATGKVLVAWSQDDWFTMVTKLSFADQSRPDMTLQYRGRLGLEDSKYNFVLQHSQLGHIEGEGWVGPETILQRFWVLGDRCTGLETLHQVSRDRYYLSSTVLTERSLVSSLEATLERLPN